jgi:hypothetical protein
MKAYRGSRGRPIAQLIVNLDPRWRSLVSIMSRSLYCRGKKTPVHIGARMYPRAGLEVLEKRKTLCLNPDLNDCQCQGSTYNGAVGPRMQITRHYSTSTWNSVVICFNSLSPDRLTDQSLGRNTKYFKIWLVKLRCGGLAFSVNVKYNWHPTLGRVFEFR